MKRIALPLLALLLLLASCGSPQGTVTAPPDEAPAVPEGLERYTASFLDVFDTMTNIVGYAESEAAFSEAVSGIHDELVEYHQLYDIYNEYEGINNLKTVNDNAGGEPVEVDQ